MKQNTNKDMNKATVYLIKENQEKIYVLTLKDRNIDWFLFKLKSLEQDLINDVLKCNVFKNIEYIQINITLYENGIQTKTKTRLYKLLSGAIVKEGF